MIGEKFRTKLLIFGGCALTAVVVIAIAVGRMSQSPAAASAALVSAEPVFAPPNSPVSPTPASSPEAPPNTRLCGCADIFAIQERIREAQTVIPLYQTEINRLQASTPVPPYSSQQYNQFQSTLLPVLDALANQPMWVYLSFMRRAHREQWFVEHPIGVREITGLTLTSPVPLRSPAAQRIVESGVLSARTGTTSLLEIEFDDQRRNGHVDFRPHLPFIFHL